MKTFRQIGSPAFVLGLFTVIFAGLPWHVVAANDPVVPWWLRIAVFALVGGILVVLLTVAIEQRKIKMPGDAPLPAGEARDILLLNSATLPGREIAEGLEATSSRPGYSRTFTRQ